MDNNSPKSSNKVRDNLKHIPDDLFDKDPNQEVNVYLLQKQIKKDPASLVQLIRRMIK